jgi:TonB-dependent starch-binding outer membrane protein SusC
MNGSLEYRQFDISMYFVGSYGNDVFNGAQRQDLRFTNRSTAILDRWTGEGTSNSIPRYTWIDVNNNYRVSDLYVEDGSFIKLKNIQVGYTFSDRFQNRINATNLRIYASAENLLTITRYTGADPEIGAMSPFNIGIDRGIYPQARTWRMGVTMTF